MKRVPANNRLWWRTAQVPTWRTAHALRVSLDEPKRGMSTLSAIELADTAHSLSDYTSNKDSELTVGLHPHAGKVRKDTCNSTAMDRFLSFKPPH